MKAIITKTGYTCGIYGNTGEYFTLIADDPNDMDRPYFMRFGGQYGTEWRVSEVLKELGYQVYNWSSTYGKCTKKDAQGARSEYQAIEEIKKDLGGTQ